MRYWSYYASLLPQLQEQTKEEPTEPEREVAPPASQPLPRSQRLGGHPLSRGLRARLERELKADLSAVRVHHDPAAADALNARAFTDGQDIVLGSEADRDALLVHEAAHVAQAGQRGTVDGISSPASATEREAQAAANALHRGDPAQVAAQGQPAPALMRQAKSGAGSAVNLVAQREAVRLMLVLQYQQQGQGSSFKLTPVVRSELQRLIPALDEAALSKLWTPEPKGPAEVFERLGKMGYLPLTTAAEPEAVPEPPKKEEEPVPEPGESKPKVELLGLGGLGVHFVLNPQPPAPVSAVIRQELAGRGISLTYQQTQAILQGRDQGIEQIERILKEVIPGLSRDKRHKLAGTIADALLTRSVKAQMRREAPSAIERNLEVEQRLQQALGVPEKTSGGVVDLLKMVPVGVSLTIHF